MTTAKKMARGLRAMSSVATLANETWFWWGKNSPTGHASAPEGGTTLCGRSTADMDYGWSAASGSTITARGICGACFRTLGRV